MGRSTRAKGGASGTPGRGGDTDASRAGSSPSTAAVVSPAPVGAGDVAAPAAGALFVSPPAGPRRAASSAASDVSAAASAAKATSGTSTAASFAAVVSGAASAPTSGTAAAAPAAAPGLTGSHVAPAPAIAPSAAASRRPSIAPSIAPTIVSAGVGPRAAAGLALAATDEQASRVLAGLPSSEPRKLLSTAALRYPGFMELFKQRKFLTILQFLSIVTGTLCLADSPELAARVVAHHMGTAADIQAVVADPALLAPDYDSLVLPAPTTAASPLPAAAAAASPAPPGRSHREPAVSPVLSLQAGAAISPAGTFKVHGASIELLDSFTTAQAGVALAAAFGFGALDGSLLPNAIDFSAATSPAVLSAWNRALRAFVPAEAISAVQSTTLRLLLEPHKLEAAGLAAAVELLKPQPTGRLREALRSQHATAAAFGPLSAIGRLFDVVLHLVAAYGDFACSDAAFPSGEAAHAASAAAATTLNHLYRLIASEADSYTSLLPAPAAALVLSARVLGIFQRLHDASGAAVRSNGYTQQQGQGLTSAGLGNTFPELYIEAWDDDITNLLERQLEAVHPPTTPGSRSQRARQIAEETTTKAVNFSWPQYTGLATNGRFSPEDVLRPGYKEYCVRCYLGAGGPDKCPRAGKEGHVVPAPGTPLATFIQDAPLARMAAVFAKDHKRWLAKHSTTELESGKTVVQGYGLKNIAALLPPQLQATLPPSLRPPTDEASASA